jgi:hypothetical protein
MAGRRASRGPPALQLAPGPASRPGLPRLSRRGPMAREVRWHHVMRRLRVVQAAALVRLWSAAQACVGPGKTKCRARRFPGRRGFTRTGGMALAAACRYERAFDGSGTIGRGPSMYEMEGPRLVSRRRPADCSASFAPLDRLPGPAAWPMFRSPETPVAQGSPSRVGQSFLRHRPGSPPRQRLRASSPGGSEFSLRRRLGVAPLPTARSPSSPGGSGRRPWPVTRGFTLCRVARVVLTPKPEVIPCRWLRGCPRCRVAQVSPSPWLGVAPLPWLGIAPCRWLQASRASGPECPLPGGTESAPRRGSGLPLYR